MGNSVLFMAFLGLLPAAVLLFYIYKKDRAEKEPPGLLIGLFFLGVLSIIPAVILEMIMQSMLNAVFFGEFTSESPEFFYDYGTYYLYQIIENFICIALVEEGCKWFFVILVTRNNKNFNCLFDGVVYTVFVSLGFAAAENLFYVFQYGFGNALLRMVTAVPAHCFFGVIMGCFYSRWFMRRKAAELENRLRASGVIAPGQNSFPSGGLLALSLFMPVLAHGFYDFCATIDSAVFTVIFLLFLGFLYFICFINVRKLSKADTYSASLSMDMVLKKHPEAAAYLQTSPEYASLFYQASVQQPINQPYAQPQYPQYQQPQQYTQPYNQPQYRQPQYQQPQYRQPQYQQPYYAQPKQGNEPPRYSQPNQNVHTDDTKK